MNGHRIANLLVLVVSVFIGCSPTTQDVTSELDIPKPDPTVPIDWNRPIPYTPKGGETKMLDGPTTYRKHFEEGWAQYLSEYTNPWHGELDIPFPCQPFSFTMAEGDGYDACKSKIAELETAHGREIVLGALQRTELSSRQ